MSIPKGPFVRNRIRRISPGFGWVDHRVVREHYVERCSHSALALYLFLVTVADGEGVSWWSERSLSQRLGMETDRLRQARGELEAADLVAYEPPVWQVLQLREAE
jgi:replication initiation and membrane attachment protein DnaB